MKKWFQVMVLAVVLILAFAPAALAGPFAADQLYQVFPKEPEPGDILTRGEFAALLARAAGVEVESGAESGPGDAWYMPAVLALKEKGVIRGYPDGSLHADDPITLLEAAVMASRALGLSEGVGAPEVNASLDRENWGYVPYAWLTWTGLLQLGQDAAARLTVEEGVAFLEKAFGSDPEAKKVVQAAQQAQTEVKDVKFAGDIDLSLRLRPETAAGVSGISEVMVQGNIESEFSYPLSLHQKMEMALSLPAEITQGANQIAGGKVNVAVEQYLVDGTLYQRIEIPRLGEPQWMKFPQAVLPDLQALIEQNRNAVGLPPGFEDYFHYQLLGDGEENGHKVRWISCYGRIDDLHVLMQAMPGVLTPEIEQFLDQSSSALKSISFWGKEAIGAEDNLPYASEVTVMVAFADEFQGEAIPLETMTMRIRVGDYRYNSGVQIRVPPEALAAPEMPLVPTESI